jgi:hypothetical protein
MEMCLQWLALFLEQKCGNLVSVLIILRQMMCDVCKKVIAVTQ